MKTCLEMCVRSVSQISQHSPTTHGCVWCLKNTYFSETKVESAVSVEEA